MSRYRVIRVKFYTASIVSLGRARAVWVVLQREAVKTRTERERISARWCLVASARS